MRGVCWHIEGAGTKNVAGRGTHSHIITDLNQPWGESETCTGCGKCVQACPTGALFNRGSTVAEMERDLSRIGFLANAAQLELRCLLAQIELLEQQQDQLEPVLTELMQQIAQHITSIPGIALATGAALLSEIGDSARFASEEKLVAYAGIDASVYQSGQFQASEAHMSKRGSPYLRHALWQAASMAIRYDAGLKAYYERKRAEGKVHGVALGAICLPCEECFLCVLKRDSKILFGLSAPAQRRDRK